MRNRDQALEALLPKFLGALSGRVSRAPKVYLLPMIRVYVWAALSFKSTLI
jgi:hypothetical protein